MGIDIIIIVYFLCLQMNVKLYIVFLLGVLRNFYNGAMATVSIYFFYLDVTFQEARDIPFCIGSVVVVTAIKSYLLLRYRKYFGHFNCLLFSHILNMVVLIAASDPNLAHKGSTFAYGMYFSIGFFPSDGEDFGVCQVIEKEYLCKVIGQKDRISIDKKYQRLGYISQAVGSLALGYYFFIVMESTIDEKFKFHELIVFFILFQIFSLLMSYRMLDGNGSEIFDKILKQPKIQPSLRIYFRLRLTNGIQGFCYGLLSANFIIYYCELKLDFYYDEIGKIICVYFLFKGIGQDFLSIFQSKYPNLIKWIYTANNLAVGCVAFFTDSTVSTVLLCSAFPLWYMGRAQISRKYEKQPSCSQLRDDLKFWQRVGVGLGTVATAYSFSNMYYRFIFGYPFILYAVVKQLNQLFISSLTTDVDYSPITDDEILQQATNSSLQQIQAKYRHQNADLAYYQQQPQYKIKNHQPQASSHKCIYILHGIIRIILYIILSLGLLFFYFNSIHGGKFDKIVKVMYQRGIIQRPKQLRLFNASLGQYLSKQDIKMVKIFECSNECLQTYQQRWNFKGMNLKPQKPQWLHFPQAPYFNSERQIQRFFSPLLQIVHKHGNYIKGFSVFWKNPLRYHKIQEELRKKVRTLGEIVGFYYQEMASLNLRGVQNKIVLVFGRYQRKRAQLPKFVESAPPHNLLAFQTTFKMVMNLPEIKEFLLYHLRAGIDKFFLYDNDPAYNDPSLLQGNRVTGYFKRCPRFALDDKYYIFQQIWQQFYDHIIYIPFTASELNLYVQLYPQYQAFQHYAAFFRQTVRYTSFTDFDEFIYSYTGQKITDTIIRLEQTEDTATNYIISKYFQFHICNPGKLNIQTYNYAPIQFRSQGQKIVMMNNLIVRSNVHGRSPKNGKVSFRDYKQFPYQIWHYQITTKLLKIIPAPLSQFSLDRSMQKFVDGLKQACRGKCTDFFLSTCTKQNEAKILKEYCQPWNGNKQ